MAGRKLTLAAGAAPMLRQVMVSVAAAIIATATLTAFHQQYAAWRTPAVPTLTSGGKFAARLESMAAGEAARPAAFTPPRLPVLLSMPLLPPRLDFTEVAGAPALPETAKPARRTVRADSKPRLMVSASADGGLPPRRADVLAEVSPVAAPSDDMDLLRTSKTLARQALGLGDALLARITPMQWIP